MILSNNYSDYAFDLSTFNEDDDWMVTVWPEADPSYDGAIFAVNPDDDGPPEPKGWWETCHCILQPDGRELTLEEARAELLALGLNERRLADLSDD